jgi:hypothetical protein
MRVIIRVDSGPTAGNRLLLRSGEILKVGRSTLNDFSVEHDEKMSEEHFQINVLSVAKQLSQRLPLYLIADFQRAGLPLPKMAGPTDFLFNELPDQTAAAISPVLLTASECKSWPDVSQALWNQNAIILMFTRVPQADAFQHLRS